MLGSPTVKALLPSPTTETGGLTTTTTATCYPIKVATATQCRTVTGGEIDGAQGVRPRDPVRTTGSTIIAPGYAGMRQRVSPSGLSPTTGARQVVQHTAVTISTRILYTATVRPRPIQVTERL